MARITVASLTAANAALLARLDVAQQVYRDQKARIAELEAQLARPGRSANAFNVKPAYVHAPRVLPAHMQAARDLAMSTKSVVLV